jgi:hypothetical protein
MGNETRTREPQRGLTFEDVWATLMELRESTQETDRIVKENALLIKETERIIKESAQETNLKMGELGNRFGELAELDLPPLGRQC